MLLKKPLPWVQDVAHEVQSHWCSNTPLLGKPSSRVHCQKKQDHSWCGANKWLWHALGAWEVQLGRWVLEIRWAPSHKGGNVTHSCRKVSLWPPLAPVFMWQTCSSSRPSVLLQGLYSLRSTHTNQGAAGSSGAVPWYSVHLHPVNHPAGLCNQEYSMAHPWPAHGAQLSCVTHWRGKERSRMRSTFGPFISQAPSTPTSPHRRALPHPNHMFPPSSSILTCTTSKSPHHPWGRWHTSLHRERWDSFLLQRLCGCHHLSDQVSTSVLCSEHHRVVCSALCDTEYQPEVIEEEGGGAAWCKELQCSSGLSPCQKGCDPGLGVCSPERHCTAQGTGNYGTLSSGCWQYSLGQGTVLTQWH